MYNRKYYRKAELPSVKLLFGNFYTITTRWKRYLISIAASILIAFLAWLFLQFTGVYSSGLSSFSQGLSRLTTVLMIRADANNAANARLVGNVLFWLTFIILNIPLAVFSYFKVGKNFTKMTVISFVIGDLFGLGLGFIPDSEKIVLIFGDSLSSFQPLRDQGVQILFWKFEPEAGVHDLIHIIPLVFYTVIGSILIPIAYSLIYIVGSSTGGTDFISYYYSIKKHKPLGTILVLFNIVSLFIGTFLGSYLSASLININPADDPHGIYHPWGLELLLSPNLIVSAIGAAVSGMIINIIFPKSKMAKLKIYSSNSQEIVDSLLSGDYTHSFTFHKSVGAFSGKESTTAETICQYIEIPQIMKKIAEIDKNALISVTLISHIKGSMNILERID
ncbi:uncharacterized membrane-anchored protein YitT (DUF2179 family) [Mycoplasmoides fastidiosum]|uniref:Uncharacterized membrane-anchored protein YitT (DUF2179 family) n=1 Tax=Mycoplasmoides fastidiosum TaxID=92758 RepID=A0ABU0LZQ2_9BACT|nr:YitT family protein [Mycoplasmoides fastidiosum]MDQ0514190.1 uncharacterized membrane-anchored protein YitT (DUF2179 family) [Mycoplasmoides fastidiosum]UUD37398.1 YitT family protein [Mycoplasmoides fastidiosum]